MSSMAALLSKPPYQNHQSLQSPNLHLTSSGQTILRHRLAGGATRVRCKLIDPDGGKLSPLIVPAGPAREARRREAAPAYGLPRMKLTRIELEWVHVLSEGWASPLRGFMRESEFLQTLHFNCLRMSDGSVVNMSVPIVLAIDDGQKRAIEGRGRVVLVDADDRPVALLKE